MSSFTDNSAAAAAGEGRVDESMKLPTTPAERRADRFRYACWRSAFAAASLVTAGVGVGLLLARSRWLAASCGFVAFVCFEFYAYCRNRIRDIDSNG